MSIMVMTFNDKDGRREGTFFHVDANVNVTMSYRQNVTTVGASDFQVKVVSPSGTEYFSEGEAAYAWGIFHGGVRNDSTFADNANIKAGIDSFHNQMVAQLADYGTVVAAHAAKFSPPAA